MKHIKEVQIEVNGRMVAATVTVDIPGLTAADEFVDAHMVLTAVANRQNLTYTSRHHKDRNVRILVNGEETPRAAVVFPPLRVVRA